MKMNKKKLVRTIGVCAVAITAIVILTVLPACQPQPPKPPTRGLQFDGVDDYVSLGNSSALLPVDGFTISCWLKTSAYPAPNRTGIITARTNEWGAGWYGDTWALCMNSSGYLWGTVTLDRPGENPVRDSILTSGPVPLDTWVHVTYAWGRNSPTGRRLCLNGQIDNEGGSRDYPVRALTKPAWIGGHTKPGSGMAPTDISFAGIISELRIYNRALSAAEIDSLYRGSDITSGLVGYWKLNEGSGTVAYDSTANNNTGTLGGNPVWYTGPG